MCSLGKTLLAFTLLHFVLQGQTCLLLQVSFDFLLLYSRPLCGKELLFLVLILESLLGFYRMVQLHFLSISGQGIDLDYCNFEWFALETSRDHSFVFKTAPKNCVLESFVDYVF